MHWPRVLKGLQVLARSVTVMPLFPSAFVSAPLTLELRARTELSELALAGAFDEALPPSAEGAFPCALDAPAPLLGLPTPEGLPAPAGRPCGYADEPRKDTVARARNGISRRVIAEIRAVWNGVRHAEVRKRRNVSEGAVKVIVPIRSRAAGAEAVLGTAGRSHAPDCGNEIHSRISERKPQIDVDIANAVCGSKIRGCGGSRGRRSADNQNRNAEIRAKIAIEIIAERGI
jgi:hypothetical protein